MAASNTVEIDVIAHFKDDTKNVTKATKKVDKFVEKTNKAKQAVDKLDNAKADPKVSIVDKASSSLSKISSGLRTFGGKTFRATVKVLDYATAPLRFIKNTLFSIKSLVLAVGAGMAANKLISDPVALADSYSSAKIGFSTLLGDKQGQQLMDDLDKFAKETPFKTSNTISQAQKMIAMGWDSKDIISDMTTIGDAAAATGKGDEGLERIVLALAQIKSKGKLSTEELNQLAEAGISAKRYLAEGLGYGSGDKGIAKLSKDLEKGAIGSEAAIKALMGGMKEYQGMMDTTANETVKGLKSQIEDTFEINIFRKWGQGLQDGMKTGLGSIVTLLDASEDGLKNLGDRLYDIGKELSNLAADKLKSVVDQAMKISGRQDFKDASLFGKATILWDEIIARPFSKWWDSKGKPGLMKKLQSAGKGIGSGLSNGLLALLGIDTSGGVMGEATSLGGSFAKGFSEGFDGSAVADAFFKAFTKTIKTLAGDSGILGKLLLGGMTISGLSKIIGAVSGIKGLIGSKTGGGAEGVGGTGLIGMLGSTGNKMVKGSGALGTMSSFGYALKGGAATSTLSGGAAAALGGGAIAGGALGALGLLSGASDLVTASASDSKSDKKRYKTRGATKIGMVGAGAAAGAAIGSIIPVAGTAVGALVGAGVGGIGALLAGNKVGDNISGVKKSSEELNREWEKLKAKNLKKHFGDIALSAEDVSAHVENIIGADTLKDIGTFSTALQTVKATEASISNSNYTIGFSSSQIQSGVELSTDALNEYTAALQNYSSESKNLMSQEKYSMKTGVKLLYGDDKSGYKDFTSGVDKTFKSLEKDMSKQGDKLNKALSKALSDGKIDIDEDKKINEIVNQMNEIQQKVSDQISSTQFESSMEAMKIKYGSSDIDADSFKAIQDELNAKVKEATGSYDDALEVGIQSLKIQLNNGDIDTTEYDKAMETLKEKYNEQVGKLLQDSTSFSLETLQQSYGKSFEKLSSSGTNVIENMFNDMNLNHKTLDQALSTMDEGIDTFIDGIADKGTQKAMGEFYKQLEPQQEQLENLKKSYESMGQDVPTWITDSLNQIDYVEALSGSSDAFYNAIGGMLAKDNPRMAEQLLAAEESGAEVPKALIKGIESAQADATVTTNVSLTVPGLSGIPAGLLSDLNIANLTTDTAVTTNTTVSPTVPFSTIAGDFRSRLQNSLIQNPLSVTIPISANTPNSGGSKTTKHATGGFVNKRQLSWVGEEGEESIIPLTPNRKGRAYDLWVATGEKLGIMNNADGGMYSDGGNSVGIHSANSNGTDGTSFGSQNGSGGNDIQVEVGGVNIQISTDGENMNNLAQLIEEQKDTIGDALCNVISDALEEAFPNLPVAAG